MAIFFFICGIVFIALGAYTIRKPGWRWERQEGWKVKDVSEPSESYLVLTKFKGLIGIVIGVIFWLFWMLKLFTSLS